VLDLEEADGHSWGCYELAVCAAMLADSSSGKQARELSLLLHLAAPCFCRTPAPK
jgi:hypothetical protein